LDLAYISIGGNKYGLVIIDDYSRFTWVFFVFDKSEVQGKVKTFISRAQREFELPIKKVRSDNGSEFQNTNVEEFLDEEGIKHEFSAPYTPQQMGWLRGIIELLLRWQEPCWTSTRLKTSFGPKQSTRFVMPSTASTFTSFTRRPPMSLSSVKSQRCLTLECLCADVSF
jgi:transposase InsO family protein